MGMDGGFVKELSLYFVYHQVTFGIKNIKMPHKTKMEKTFIDFVPNLVKKIQQP